MKKKEKYYDGDRLDKNNRTSDRFLAVNSCGIQSYGPHACCRTVREHGRVDYNLIYVESGMLEAEFGDEEVCVTAGGYLLYPPQLRQDYQQHGGVNYWVHFTGTAIEELLSAAGLLGVHSFQGKQHEPRITRIFGKMIFHSVSKPVKSETLIIADLTELIAELEKLTRDTEPLFNDERLHPIILQMHHNYAKDVDLGVYAASAGMCRSRFLHLFKEVTGKSPLAYIQQLRLSHAAELLLTCDDPVSQIATEVGISDPLYFSRLFKKEYGMSPNHFRKGLR